MRFQEVREFLGAVMSCGNLLVLQTLVANFLKNSGFSNFACVSHVDRANKPLQTVDLHNYPTAWEAHFREFHLEKIDPVQRFCRHRLMPFHWNEPSFLELLSRDQLRILEDATAFGLEKGFTVPLHAPNRHSASFSVASRKDDVDPSAYSLVQVIAPAVFEKALSLAHSEAPRKKDTERLSRRELECLQLVASGKSDWVIGELLSLSERTVHGYIENAKKRLGVATRTQAVICALHDAQLSIDDIRSPMR